MAETISVNTSNGVFLTSAGQNPLSILAGVVVTSGEYGIYGNTSQAWTILNAGTVSGGNEDGGILLKAGGSVTNSGTAARISYGVGISGVAGTVTNQGTIAGVNADGVFLQDGGTVTNSGAFSDIAGGYGWGVYIASGTATVTNRGTLSGPRGAVHFSNANNNVFYDLPGAVTNGSVYAGVGASSQLELGAGGTPQSATAHLPGTITGIGSLFAEFRELAVESGARWLVTGANSVAGYIDLAATSSLAVTGTLVNSSIFGLTLAGAGTLAAVDGGRIEVGTAGTARAGQIVVDAGFGLTTGGEDLVAQLILNRGNIADPNGTAVLLGEGGAVTNASTAAHITGSAAEGAYGVFAHGLTTIVNQGTVSGGEGIYLVDGAVTNSGAAARIDGRTFGVFVFNGTGDGFTGAVGPVTITNQGSISGNYQDGVSMLGGTLVNDSTGRISGGSGGVFAQGGAATVINQGTISSPGYYGVALDDGGLVTNSAATASISGKEFGVSAGDSVITVANVGSIAGALYAGVWLGDGGQVINDASGAAISGGQWGVYATGATATVTNAGSITGTGLAGVELAAGGTVTNNASTARISGGQWGVAITGAGNVTNQGSISGLTGDGVYVGGGSVLSNDAGGAISGGQSGIYAGGARVTITNIGGITGTANYGVLLPAGGTLTNAGAASHISGGLYGVYVSGGVATVSNQGTITGADAAVHFANANGNVFHDFPGAVANGVVAGGSGADTLELGSGASTGTISGIGVAFTGFEVLAVDAGARWQAAGANALGASSTIALAGSLGVAGTLTAASNLTITGAGTLAAAGRIEVGTANAALAGQIVIDAGQTLTSTAELSAASAIIAAGGVLLGSGTVAAPVANAGKVETFNGTLGITGDLTGSGTIQVLAGSALTLDGVGSTAAFVLNQGTLTVGAGDSLDITGSVNPASAGLFILNAASLLEIAADTGASNKMDFLGAAGKLAIDNAAQFGTNVGLGAYTGPLLEHFIAGDAVDLKNLLFAGATIDSFTAATGLLQLHSGSTKATLEFQNSSLGAGSFHLGADPAGHVLLTHS